MGRSTEGGKRRSPMAWESCGTPGGKVGLLGPLVVNSIEVRSGSRTNYLGPRSRPKRGKECGKPDLKPSN